MAVDLLKTRILALRRILLSTVRLFGNGWSATTICKNVETLRLKTGLFYLKLLFVTNLWDITPTPPSPPIKIAPPSLEHGLVLLSTLTRGGGITSTTKNCLFKCKNPTEHNRNMSYRGLFIPESLHLTGFFKGSQMLQLNSEYRSNNGGGLEKAVFTFSCILIS